MKILLVNLDKGMTSDLTYSFEKDGSKTYMVGDMDQAKALADREGVDLVLLAGRQNDSDFLHTIERFKEGHGPLVIVLSQSTDPKDAVLALEYGADDYMKAPIHILELKARIRALQRNRGEKEDQKPLTVDIPPLRFQLVDHEISSGDLTVSLSEMDFRLLYTLADQAGLTLSREDLASKLWADEFSSRLRTVDVYIQRLRKKLSRLGLEDLVETRWKEGYVYNNADWTRPGQ